MLQQDRNHRSKTKNATGTYTISTDNKETTKIIEEGESTNDSTKAENKKSKSIKST
jgi:hypothetical protein